MLDNEELPIGFTMELALHPEIMSHFSGLPQEKQNSVIDGAREISSPAGYAQLCYVHS